MIKSSFLSIARRNHEMKVAFLLIALVVPSFAKNFGSIPIAGAGNVYVVGPDWTGDFLRIEGNGFSLNGGGRIYFASQPNDGFDPNMYWQVSVPIFNTYMVDQFINDLSFIQDPPHGPTLQLHD